MHHLLKVQGEALVNKFGCSSELPGLLRQLWLSHIPSTGILEPQPHRALRNRTALGTAAAAAAAAAAGGGSQHLGQQGGDVSDEDGSSDGEQQQQQQQQQHGVRALSGLRAAQLVEPHNMKQLLWKLLHPQATLQLCFLGCVLLREAVTLFELLRWALDGQLPFLELPHCSMQVATGGVLSILPVRCLQPQLQLDPLAFCNSCCQLAAQLGLALPQPPGEALLLRTIKELGLPQVVYETALQLYCLYLIDTPEMQSYVRRLERQLLAFESALKVMDQLKSASVGEG
ncbi:hypothetical protein OEZ85_014186 [Tetradesmus obliquus]|uniref:Rrn7/TAF1B N-terminal cyclin domain-containing protein n=1 Tax=Tetradesmus obliquus TaxID=3088 RepID=A0ABY8U787_TETOB|nr:hypothetical protein OEZ85_014186 [Tetradesmus obliquus]